MRYASLLDILCKKPPHASNQNDALLLQRVTQFTDIEDSVLDAWLQLENANLDELAARVLNDGLLFEHYLSQLADDPDKRTDEQKAQLETFRMNAQTSLDQGRAALATKKP